MQSALTGWAQEIHASVANKMTLKLNGYNSMNGHVYYKCLTPQGRIVRVGDQYINAQGIELKVGRIFKPEECADILVEFAPVDMALEGRCWQGEFLVQCGSKGAPRNADEAGYHPRVYIEDVDSMTSADDVSAELDAAPVDETENGRNPDYLAAGMS